MLGIGGPLFRRVILTLELLVNNSFSIGWIAIQLLLVHQPRYAPDSCQNIEDGAAFDFIVVGGGSGGATVARRLAEVSTWDILLLEAGTDPQAAIEIPYAAIQPLAVAQTWGWNNVPSETACLSMAGGQCDFSRNKVLGGCSTNNYMMYSRGNKQDYADWTEVGNKGWTYEDVLPFYKKSENFLASPIDDGNNNASVSSKYHSKGGPLSVNNYFHSPDMRKLRKAFLQSGENQGYPHNPDYNGETQIGVSDYFGTLDKKMHRQNTAKAFLVDVPENLIICKHSVVDTVLFEDKKAVGVKYAYKGTERTAKAKKEVILSAGAFNTPGILERSGIGDPQVLEKVGVALRHELPGVGNNMQDHFWLLGNAYVGDTLPEGYSDGRSMSLIGTGGFINSRGDSEVPDLQFINYVSPPVIFPFFSGVRLKLSFYAQLIKHTFGRRLIGFTPCVLRSSNRNNIHIVSKNPLEKPKFEIHHFSNDDEIQTMLRGVKIINKMIADPVFEKFKLSKIPLKPCSTETELWSDDYYICLMRHTSTTLYHPVGSCMMGPESNPRAVVNDKLEVHGLKNLRVADASIFPNITRGNTNAPTIMVGERAADFIKKKYKQNE